MKQKDIAALLDELASLYAAYWESPRFDADLGWVLPHTSGPIHEIFSSDTGVVLLIEHDMRVVMDISENIAVMDFGTKIAQGTPEEVSANQDVIDAYLGVAH